MKNQKTMGALALAFAGALFSLPAIAQVQVYSENFDTDVTADWNVNSRGNLSPANLFFDYSTVGIPPAPHTTGGTTRGLKMQANLPPGLGVFPSGVSVSPKNFGITENFEMHWDMWINFNGPFPGSGNGSTQIGGGGYGTAGTNANVPGIADAVFIGASGDGGTISDYRVYSPGKAVSYQGDVSLAVPRVQYVLDGGFFGPGGTDFRAGDANSGFVYAGAGGSRDSDVSPFTTAFPGQTAPAAQLTLFPQQTGTTKNGAAGMKWRDVSITKIANSITYRIDGVLIATVDAVDAAIDPFAGPRPLGGTNILFNHYDINGTSSTDTNAPALAFSLIDNVRITNFSNVVSVQATVPNASETGPANGTFVITRTSAGVPLTVNYTLTGSASNGVDYVTLPGSITFGATATSTNITVVPIDDSISETEEAVTLTINASPNYVGAGSAIVRIQDNEPPQLTISAVHQQMYERTNDYAEFRITRLGNTNSPAFAVNVTFSGTATLDTDFTTNGIMMFNPGDAAVILRVLPIEDTLLEGNETIQCTVIPTADYSVQAVNAATLTIVDATLPTETILFSDSFTTDSSANWTRLFGAAPDATEDFLAIFAYDYGADGIPVAPHSTGDTLGLRLTVNKNDPTPAAAALNFYPNDKSFSGNYALRFDMYLVNGGGSSATEDALFGINHSGTKTNWFRGSSGGVSDGSFDGIFFDVEADAGSAFNYGMFSSPTVANNPTTLATTNASSFAGIFKAPPWAVTGVAANSNNSATPIWADVEVSQLAGVITLKINKTVILQRNNATSFTTGNIMLGYLDSFDSIGPSGATVIYDNVRVVQLSAPAAINITSIQLINGGTQVQINFTGGVNDSFALVSSGTVAGPYGATTASITSTGPGTFQAVASVNGTTRFYQIKLN